MYAPAPDKFLDEEADELPTSLYGEAKLIIERYITLSTSNAIILRCSNAWGGKIVENRRNGFIDRLIYNSMLGIPVTISVDRQSVLSIVHVKDIASSILKGIKRLDSHSRKTEIYNISAEALSIDSIVRQISAVCPIKENYLGGITNFTKVSSAKACNVLRWSPGYLLNSPNIRLALDAYK
jgi:nucleoside-diphosphate-sugar epimerase